MANNSLTILTNRSLALVLKSPIQMGWLSIINSVTNISRLGIFKPSPLEARNLVAYSVLYNIFVNQKSALIHPLSLKICEDSSDCEKSMKNLVFAKNIVKGLVDEPRTKYLSRHQTLNVGFS